MVLVIVWTFSENVFSGFQGVFITWACGWVWGERKEEPMELSCVGVTSSALENSSKDFLFVLEVLEVFGGGEGWGSSVGNCESAVFGGIFPFLLP